MDLGRAVRAIVFDANVFGQSVEPNIDTIENWASACESHGAELWIPEIVVWELAQRVLQAASEMEATIKAHNTRRRKWGFDPMAAPPQLTLEMIEERLEAAGAIIIRLTGKAASAAIRDQLLLSGPASRKKEVKTGAADSGWIRSVIEHSQDRVGGLIVVTGDTDAVLKTCEALGITAPTIARHLGEIADLLKETSTASAEQSRKFLSIAKDFFVGPDVTGADLQDILGLSRRNRLDDWWQPDLGIAHDDRWEFQQSFIRPVSIEPVNELKFDGWSGSTTGRVRITVEVEEQYARQDQWGDYPEYRAFSYDAWIEGNLTIFPEAERGTGPGVLEDPRLGVIQDTVHSQRV